MPAGFSVGSSTHGLGKTGVGVIRLGGLLALVPRDGLDGAERSVEPGLLGGLHLVQGQTQVVLQVLVEDKINQQASKTVSKKQSKQILVHLSKPLCTF